MKVETFCTILIYSLLNFMAFLISVSFLVSVEDTNDDDNITAISVLFSFFFICFFIFLVSLMIIIKHDKFDKEKLNDNIAPNTEENKENKENVNPPNQEGNIIVNINEEEQKTDDRLNKNKEVIYQNSEAYQINIIINNQNNNNVTVINYNEQNNNENNPNDNNNNNENNNNENNMNSNDINNNEEDIQKSDETLMKILLYTFIICQLFYFAELITVTTFYGKRKTEIIYRDLVITGYIFFCVFAILYILLIALKFTKSARERILHPADGGLFACCNEFIENRCNDLNKCFKTKTDEEIKISNRERVRELENEIEEIRRTITELEDYKKRLTTFNDKLSNLRQNDRPLPSDNILDAEFTPLNIFRIVT